MPKKAAIVIALGNDTCTDPDSPAIVMNRWKRLVRRTSNHEGDNVVLDMSKVPRSDPVEWKSIAERM